MSIKRLFDAVERSGDIGRRVAALVLPISNRPRVTSSCAGKIRLREPGEHTTGPNLASRDNVAHNRTLYDSGKPHRSSRFVESRPGHTLSDGHMLFGVPRMLAQSCRPWAEEVRAMLAWHGVDSASTSREDLWRMYRCGYSASGAAAFAVNLARQQVEMDACRRR